VRTILGEIGGVKDGMLFSSMQRFQADVTVRMLFKSGYRNVYVSRQFAVKNGLVDAKVSYPSLFDLGNKLISSTAWAHLATLVSSP
jgi:hypothetical protein